MKWVQSVRVSPEKTDPHFLIPNDVEEILLLYFLLSIVRFCCHIMYFFFIYLTLSVLSQEIG